jgi:hypothetical protein
MFIEIGAGLVGAVSGSAMVLGMNPCMVAAAIAGGPALDSIIVPQMMRSATAVLLVAGFSVGLIAGYGAGGFVGGLM